MMKKTREEQIKLLQTIGSPAMARNIGFVLAVLCAVLFAISAYQKDWFFAVLALMLGSLAFVGKKSILLVQNAAKAWRHGRAQPLAAAPHGKSSAAHR